MSEIVYTTTTCAAPTNKLRFVERESYTKNGESFIEPYKYKILQQYWGSANTEGEWRDVPIEKEFIDEEKS
jgi:hypothetical protein